MTFSSFTITGTNAADFAIGFNNCTRTPASWREYRLASCTFTPSIVGVKVIFIACSTCHPLKSAGK